MKLASSALAFALLTAACSTVAMGQKVLAQSAPAVVAVPAAVTPAPAGKAVYERLCTGCHEASLVEAVGHTKPEWEEAVNRMFDRGLEATPQEVAQVVDYLTVAVPPGK